MATMISLPTPNPHTTMPSISLGFAELTRDTEWVRAIDPDMQLYVETSALYADFYGTLDLLQTHCTADDFVCIDLEIDGSWVCWDDCPELPHPADQCHFRYILTA